MKIEIFKGNWVLDIVRNNTDKIFVFGDNNARIGKGGQAIIRDLPNTIGIRTKKGPSKKSAAFYRDSEFELNSKNILDDILSIKKEAIDGKTIVFSNNGYGTGLASLKDKAPKTFEYLCFLLREHFNFNNETGKRWYKIPGHMEITNGVYVDFDNNENILKPINNSYFKSEFLEKGLNTTYDLIKSGNKVAFTSNIKYKNNDILIFTFIGKNYLVCRVIDSYDVDLINDKWYSFEGYDKSFSIDMMNKQQTHIQYICTLDDKGNMVYKNDIFTGEYEPKVDIEKIKKKAKVVGITTQNKSQNMNDINNEILESLKRIESKLDRRIFKNPFRRKTIGELLLQKGLVGNFTKINSILSNNKYVLCCDDGLFYYFNFNEGFIFNTIEIILVSGELLH